MADLWHDGINSNFITPGAYKTGQLVGSTTNASAIANNDNLYFTRGAVNIVNGCTGNTAVTLGSLSVIGGPDRFRGTLGSSSAVIDINTKALYLAGLVGEFWFSGNVADTAAGLASIEKCKGNGSDDFVNLSGDIDILEVSDSDVSIAAAATIVTAMHVFNGSRVIAAVVAANIPLIRVNRGGYAKLGRAPTLAYVAGGGELVIEGETGAAMTAHVEEGGKLQYKNFIRPTKIYVYPGGVFSLVDNPFSFATADTRSIPIQHHRGSLIDARTAGTVIDFSVSAGDKVGGGGRLLASGARSSTMTTFGGFGAVGD